MARQPSSSFSARLKKQNSFIPPPNSRIMGGASPGNPNATRLPNSAAGLVRWRSSGKGRFGSCGSIFPKARRRLAAECPLRAPRLEPAPRRNEKFPCRCAETTKQSVLAQRLDSRTGASNPATLKGICHYFRIRLEIGQNFFTEDVEPGSLRGVRVNTGSGTCGRVEGLRRGVRGPCCSPEPGDQLMRGLV